MTIAKLFQIYLVYYIIWILGTWFMVYSLEIQNAKALIQWIKNTKSNKNKYHLDFRYLVYGIFNGNLKCKSFDSMNKKQ